MTNLISLDTASLLGFVVVFSRISGLIFSAPLLSERTIPRRLKVLLAFIFALVLYPVVGDPSIPNNPETAAIFFLIFQEVVIGLFMGFTAQVLFMAVMLAGEIISFQMGLSAANVLNPSLEAQLPLLSQLLSVLTLLVFTTLDGHHLLIRSVVESYNTLAVGGFDLAASELSLAGLVGQIFWLGIQFGAPLITALLAANIAIGLLARAVPQINIFIVGFPFTIGLGILFLAIGMPFLQRAVAATINILPLMLMRTVQLLSS